MTVDESEPQTHAEGRMRQKRILFLMHEGVESTIFQSQVAVHALEMKRLGYEMEIWSFETTLRSLKRSERNVAHAEQLSTSRVRLLRGMYVFLPFSDVINAIVLLFHIRRASARFDLVHARTDYSASVYSHIARWVGVPMVWDCRGDSFREIEHTLSKRTKLPGFVKRPILKAINDQEARAGQASAVANFVSTGLFERKSKSLHGKPHFVIPCAVSGKYFYFDPQLRSEYRSRLGFDRTAVVLVYSGAMSAYQGFEKYTYLVSRILGAGDQRIRFLVVTPDRAKALAYLGEQLPRHVYMLCSASYEEMNGFLNAADYGALLRERNGINDVSSPTKFGEYCLAGLPVILDGNVAQAREVAVTVGNSESYDDVVSGKPLIPAPDDERAQISNRSQRIFGRQYLNSKYDALYRAALNDHGEAVD